MIRVGASAEDELKTICKQYHSILVVESIPKYWVEKVEWVLSKIDALKLLSIHNDPLHNYHACLEALNKWLLRWVYQVNEKEQN